jgi:hypothetical protein
MLRGVRSVVVAGLLTLGWAPAASAHAVPDVDHRDTPAELADGDINRSLALSRVTGTTAGSLTPYQPTTWCGTERTTDDVTNAAFPASAPQTKIVYAYASDRPNGFTQWRDAIQGSVSHIQEFLAEQSGGRRALRFDMGTSCGRDYVDIQVVALPQPRSAYYNDFADVANDVYAAIEPATGPRNVLVIGDSLSSTGLYGTAEVTDDDQPGALNATNGGGNFAVMWTTTTTGPSASGSQPTVLLHEISHNLGAVQWSAPHTTHTAGDPTGTYSHCWDGYDVMCYQDGPSMAHPYETSHCPTASGAIDQTYDCGRDDYFNPDPAPSSYLATHWNVYNSFFLGSCTQLGLACGGNTVPTPPVNSIAPSVSGIAQRGAVLTAGIGTWLNAPTSYATQWQRAAGADWQDIPGAATAAFVPTAAEVGAVLRVVVTATNVDGSAIVASGPTAPIADLPQSVSPTPAPTGPLRVAIVLRDRGRRNAGTLSATVRSVAAGREVRTAAARIALPAGNWRLRLCAGPAGGSQRCALTPRVRSRKGSVRLPAVRVLVTTAGPLRLGAAVIDGRLRVRAQGTAAGA